MKVRFRLSALFAVMAALLLAFASPALAKGGAGGGGGGGGGGGATTTVPPVSCAQIVSLIVDPNPAPANVHPLPGQAYVADSGVPSGGPAVAVDLTVNNQCVDEVAAGPRGSVSVATTTFDTATGARLFTGVNMQPAFMLMTWRTWALVPAADATVPNVTVVISVTKANGQVQDTLTYPIAAMNRAILTAAATGAPVSLR